MRNPIPLALALALVSTGLQLAALFPEHTPQYWQLLVLIGIAGQLLAVIVVTAQTAQVLSAHEVQAGEEGLTGDAQQDESSGDAAQLV